MPDEFHEAVRLARAAWPGIDLPTAAFEAYLRARWPDAAPPAERARDLYLAFGCARGDARALAAFESEHGAELRRVAQARTRSPALADEALQVLRERLFVSAGGELPEIADFNGAGPLAWWLRIATVRIAQRLARAEGRSSAPLDAFAASLETRDDPDLALVRRRYGHALPEALRAAWAACEPAARNLLRYRYLDELSIDDIARLRGVHRATAARWLQRAEESLVRGALDHLARAFGTQPDEIKSLLRLIRSGLQLSARKLFEP